MPDRLAFDEWTDALAAAIADDGVEVACQHVRGHAGDPEHACVRGIRTAPFEVPDVAAVIRAAPGEPHRKAPWIGVFRLGDGRFCVLRAWRCGVGWQCHCGGGVEVARDLDTLLLYSLDDRERRRLGIFLG